MTHNELCIKFRTRSAKSKVGYGFGLGSWRVYRDGEWTELNELEFRSSLQKSILKDVPTMTNPVVNSVLALLKAELFVSDDKWNPPDLLGFKDGVLRISTKEFMPHSPNFYLTSLLPYPYDPTAKAEMWTRFLMGTVPECQDFLQEFAGYCASTSTRYEKALWLYGPAGGGKSTFITGLEAMLGEKCCVLGLQDMDTSQFGLTNLMGKTLAIATEQPANFIKSANVINTLISGERLNINRKYKDMVTINPQVKIIWAMNELPRISSQAVGIFRRVDVVYFPEIAVRDPRIKEEIARSGMGILNWALEGYERLQKRGHFVVPDSVEQATKNYKLANDAPQLFLNECCEIDPDSRVQATQLYSEYRKWCRENGYHPETSTKFGRDMDRLGIKFAKSSIIYRIGVRMVEEIQFDVPESVN